MPGRQRQGILDVMTQLALPGLSDELDDARELLRQLIARCPAGQDPGAFVIGRAVWSDFVLRRALRELGLPHIECPDPECWDPWHVTLLASGASGRSQWNVTLPEDDPERWEDA